MTDHFPNLDSKKRSIFSSQRPDAVTQRPISAKSNLWFGLANRAWSGIIAAKLLNETRFLIHLGEAE
jgi:hypothetical protein